MKDMNDDSRNNNNYEMMKCIWMASHVIEYKLCDNQFDCENCMFDKGIRNLLNEKETQSAGINNIVNVVSDKLHEIKYDDRIIYLKNNLIAKEICSNTFYIGINPILTSFLDSASSIVLNDCGRNILAGEQIIQFSGVWGAISISAPMNFMIYDKVGDPTGDYLKSKWIAIISAEQNDISKGTLHKEGWDKMHDRAVNIINEIKLQIPKVGDTMMDGGTQIKFLHQIVGDQRYLNILTSLSA